jgi:hypothetical protein
VLKWFENRATEAGLHGVNAIDGRFCDLRLTSLLCLVWEKIGQGWATDEVDLTEKGEHMMATAMLTIESPQAVHRRATPCVLLLIVLDID